MKTESERVEFAPIQQIFPFAEERERFLQECCELYCSERPLSDVVFEKKRLASLRNSLTNSDETSQVPLAVERASQIDKTSTADVPKVTSAEQQSAERATTLQATTEQLNGRAAAEKAIATKPAPEQHSILKRTAEPVRARGK